MMATAERNMKQMSHTVQSSPLKTDTYKKAQEMPMQNMLKIPAMGSPLITKKLQAMTEKPQHSRKAEMAIKEASEPLFVKSSKSYRVNSYS